MAGATLASVLNGNHFTLYGETNPGIRGSATGGYWDGAGAEAPGGAGRFALDLSRLPGSGAPSVGFRCVLPR